MKKIEKLKQEIELLKKMEEEKKHELELLEIEELEKTIPIQKHYGFDTNTLIAVNRGKTINLNYTINHGFRGGYRNPNEILKIENDCLVCDQNNKVVSIDDVNWPKAIAIIKYYKLDNNNKLKSISELMKSGSDCEGTETFNISLFDATFSYDSSHEEAPRGLNILIDFFLNYFK